MKTSSAPPPVLPDRARLKACQAANTFVLPGIGSWLAGDRAAGVGQMLLALAGSALSTAWFLGVFRDYLRAAGGDELPELHLGMALAGLGLFAAAWIWAQATNARLRRLE